MGPDPSAINNVNDQMGSRCVQLLIMLIIRWGPGVFSYYHHWWIVPVIATHAGAVAGAWIYYLAIEVIVLKTDLCMTVQSFIGLLLPIIGAWMALAALVFIKSSRKLVKFDLKSEKVWCSH